jgi:hypothetical protein
LDTERRHSDQLREMQLRIQRLEMENEELRKKGAACTCAHTDMRVNNGPPPTITASHTPTASQLPKDINKFKPVAYNTTSNH